MNYGFHLLAVLLQAKRPRKSHWTVNSSPYPSYHQDELGFAFGLGKVNIINSFGEVEPVNIVVDNFTLNVEPIIRYRQLDTASDETAVGIAVDNFTLNVEPIIRYRQLDTASDETAVGIAVSNFTIGVEVVINYVAHDFNSDTTQTNINVENFFIQVSSE